MAKTKDENGDGGKTENVDGGVNEVLGAILKQNADLMAQLVANQPIKVITQDSPEFQNLLRDQGYFDTFPKPVYQNGYECEARGLSEDVRTRAANLTPGTYTIKGVTVVVEPSANGGVHLKYRSRSVEDRMKYAAAWSDFSDLVNTLWDQMHTATV